MDLAGGGSIKKTPATDDSPEKPMLMTVNEFSANKRMHDHHPARRWTGLKLEIMENRVFVTYASKAGSTAEIVVKIGEALAKRGVAVDLLPVSKYSIWQRGGTRAGALRSGER